MQSSFFIKTAVVFGLSLLLWAPLSMIGNLVDERSQRQFQVTADIAASSAGAQRLFGPILAVPYTEQWTETVDVTENDVVKKRKRNMQETRILYFAPEDSALKGDLSVETKRRGLFKVRSYVLEAKIEGSFRVPAGYGKPKPDHNGTIAFGMPYLAVSVSDMRGVLDARGVDWNGRHYDFEQGAHLPYERATGMHTDLADQALPAETTDVPFSFSLRLRGLQQLDIAPLAKHTRAELTSPWPHPSFHGRFLPDPASQSIGPDGFRALWMVNALAANVAENMNQCRALECFDSFGLEMVDPINIYSLSDRAVKYGFLFVGLTFAAIFLFELARKLAIHPAQYTLVGLALAMFFLLLLSLSEHLTFSASYAIAACSTVSLIGFYLSAVLGSLGRGAGAGGLLAVLFSALYGLLQSEDNALMLGSLLLFGALALAMTVTRRLDWYALSANATAANPAP